MFSGGSVGVYMYKQCIAGFGVVLMLSACGGGGGGGSGPVTSPPPPPVSPPPPPPPPSVQFQGFLGSQSGVVDYFTNQSIVEFTLDGNGIIQTFSGSTSTQDAVPDSNDDRVTYNPATETFTVTASFPLFRRVGTFGPDALDTIINDEAGYLVTTGNLIEVFGVLLPGVAPSNFDNSALLAWVGIDAVTNKGYAAYMPFGVQTDNADMPTTGTATYQGLAIGILLKVGDEPSDLTGPATATANFGTGTVSTQFDLTATEAISGAETAYDTLTGSATISAGDNLAPGGTLIGTTNTALSGEFNGVFFGPAANEFGGNWFVSDADEVAHGAFLTDSDP